MTDLDGGNNDLFPPAEGLAMNGLVEKALSLRK
jgi:hypothetical protein